MAGSIRGYTFDLQLIQNRPLPSGKLFIGDPQTEQNLEKASP